MAQFGAVYQDGRLIAADVMMTRTEEQGTLHPRWRIQAIFPRSIADRIAKQRLRHPIYQIEFAGHTEDYFVVGHPLPTGSDPSILHQDFLSVNRSSVDGRV